MPACRASRSNSRRPTSVASSRSCKLIQCLILLRAREVLHEAQPIAAGRVSLLRNDFHHVAIRERVPQRNNLPVHLAPDALIAHFRVDRVSKIHRRGAARQHDHAPLRREGVNLFGI